MRIAPTFITQLAGRGGDRALDTLGASITLTPGTLTLDIDSRERSSTPWTPSARDVERA
jgi:multisubunit Na+/H+ antiporter MnhE subunit